MIVRILLLLHLLVAPATAGAGPHLRIDPLGDLYAVVAIATPAQIQHASVQLPRTERAGRLQVASEWLLEHYDAPLAPGPAQRQRLALRFDPARLLRLERRATIALRLGLPDGEHRLQLTVWPPSDVPYYAATAPADRRDLSWLFAAFVEPEAPELAGVLRDQRQRLDQARALLRREDPRYAELLAAWNALEPLRLRYLLAEARQRDGIAVQQVRRIEQVLARRAANCVESSVLLASVLERQRVPVALVFEPGHMWLAVALAGGYAYVETTELTRIGADAELDLASSWVRLHRALQLGHARALARPPPGPQVLDLERLRRLGVRPLAAALGDGRCCAAP